MAFNEPTKKNLELLSLTSHQLKNPLQAIKQHLLGILAQNHGEISGEIRGALNQACQASDRLERLINVFLNVAKIEEGIFGLNSMPNDLVAIIAEVVKELTPEAEQKKLELIFYLPQQPVKVFNFDALKIKDALLNIVDNAIKYTPKGKVEIILEQTGQAVQVKVKDTGLGLAKNEYPKLFNKFARGNGMAQVNPNGNGLGLFIAKQIIESHGGKIWAESVGPKMGSTFIFTLPVP
ncbi:MAG: HAMP domain-containing sensor histidine kinase [Patescibacteria group bacterium]|jgi:two-component system CheB/CheR fusion protein